MAYPKPVFTGTLEFSSIERLKAALLTTAWPCLALHLCYPPPLILAEDKEPSFRQVMHRATPANFLKMHCAPHAVGSPAWMMSSSL